jgi:hypothetical protein
MTGIAGITGGGVFCNVGFSSFAALLEAMSVSLQAISTNAKMIAAIIRFSFFIKTP